MILILLNFLFLFILFKLGTDHDNRDQIIYFLYFRYVNFLYLYVWAEIIINLTKNQFVLKNAFVVFKWP